MAARAQDRRVQRTRALLREALMDLMPEQGYEAVTIQEIIDRANVGRSTFYAHFLDKQALLESVLEDLGGFLAQQIAPTGAREAHCPELGFSLAMFHHAQSHHRLYLAMVGKQSGTLVQQHIQRILADLVRQELKTLVPNSGPSPIPLEMLVQYTVSSYLGLLTWWLDQKMPCSAEEMDRMFRSLTLPGITAALRLPPAVS